MEKLLEPESFKKDALGTSYRRNKWRGYGLGRHTPKPLLIHTMEVAYPGTQSLIDHVLWDVLRPKFSTSTHAPNWLGRLSPRVASMIANPKSRARHGGLRAETLDKLERMSDLDAMACVTVFLRSAIESKITTSEALMLSESLCRMAIVGAPFLYSHGVAGPLAEYFDAFLLSRQPLTVKHELRAADYLRRAKKAAWYIRCVEGDENRLFSQAEKNDVVLEMINGSYGNRVQTAIAPVAT